MRFARCGHRDQSLPWTRFRECGQPLIFAKAGPFRFCHFAATSIIYVKLSYSMLDKPALIDIGFQPQMSRLSGCAAASDSKVGGRAICAAEHGIVDLGQSLRGWEPQHLGP